MIAATEPGTVLGTVGYMSPEQVKGRLADHRSDLFSLGAVLYEMLTGRRAFQRDTAAETMTAILGEDPPDFSASGGAAIPSLLERIVRHSLEKNPEDRFQSARDLAFDLESLSGAGVSAISAPAPRPRAARFGAAASAAVVAAALLAGGFLLGRGAHRPLSTSLRRITFRHGNLLNARFTPDGQSVVYGAAWDGRPTEVFTTRGDGTQSRPLGIPKADVLAVSPKGELAVLLKKGFLRYPTGLGTLAVLPLEGGVPRELIQGVKEASYGPDGVLAVVRVVGGERGRNRIEYPPDHLLYESSNDLSALHISPAGDLVVFAERLVMG